MLVKWQGTHKLLIRLENLKDLEQKPSNKVNEIDEFQLTLHIKALKWKRLKKI